jgi:hypothetical protein
LGCPGISFKALGIAAITALTPVSGSTAQPPGVASVPGPGSGTAVTSPGVRRIDLRCTGDEGGFVVEFKPIPGAAAQRAGVATAVGPESQAAVPSPKVTRVDLRCTGEKKAVVVEFESIPNYLLYRDADEIVLSLARALWEIPERVDWQGCEPVAGYRLRRRAGRDGGQLRIAAPELRVEKLSRIEASEPGHEALELRLAAAAAPGDTARQAASAPARPRLETMAGLPRRSARAAAPGSTRQAATARAPADAAKTARQPRATTAGAGGDDGGQAATAAATAEPATAAVLGVRLGEHEGMTRLVLDLSGPLDFRASSDGPALVVDLHRARWLASERREWRRGRVRGYRYADGRLRIEGAAALAWRRRFLLPSEGRRGHRLVLDVALSNKGERGASIGN